MRPQGKSNHHEDFFGNLKPGDKFFMIEKESPYMPSYWFVGFSPVSFRSVVAIETSSENKAVVINIHNDCNWRTTFTTDEKEAYTAYIREAIARAASIQKYFNPEDLDSVRSFKEGKQSSTNSAHSYTEGSDIKP